MKNDEISAIVNFGAAIFEKVGTKNINYVSQRMRQLARLLRTLRKENEAANFDDFIDTARFDELVAAVKDLCGFKEESRLEIDVPSLAIKLGHSIKQCAQVLKSSALRKKDEAAIRECQNLIGVKEAKQSRNSATSWRPYAAEKSPQKEDGRSFNDFKRRERNANCGWPLEQLA